MDSVDEKFMKEALLEAKKAFTLEEVPVGAVLVFQGNIIARAHNEVEKAQDASCHAELLCLRSAAKDLNNWRLLETTLYCTLEPCLLCAGALILFRVKKIVYGARDFRHGAHGSFIDVFSQNHPIHQLEVQGGVCEKAAAELMRLFFMQRRNKNV